tara:strand:+ start:88 stop:357 length:270 start_codon:yes stop_codon:yes gene_type:complete
MRDFPSDDEIEKLLREGALPEIPESSVAQSSPDQAQAERALLDGALGSGSAGNDMAGITESISAIAQTLERMSEVLIRIDESLTETFGE